MMNYLVALFGLLILVTATVGVFAPERLMKLVDIFWTGERSLYIAAGVRILLGTVLILAAPTTHLPGLITALGVIAFLVGIALLVLGYQRVDKFIRWWQKRPPNFVRVGALFAVLFGALLVWASV